MIDKQNLKTPFKYHVRLFPPIGDGEKLFFDTALDLGISIKRIYDKFKLDELECTNGWYNMWKKDPLEFFCEHVQVTRIDTQKCPKHQNLYK